MADESSVAILHPTDEGAVGHSASGFHSLASAKSARSLRLNLNEGVPMFTVKAGIAGAISGSICTFLALYYGLKTGITPSMNILGGVLGFAFTKLLMKLRIFGNTFTPQENAVIQTLSVAVYSVACPAFGFANGYLAMSKEAYYAVDLADAGDKIEYTVDLNYWRSLVWALSLFSFGFFLAYPVRNYYILKKQLLFPSGTATAWVINALHASRDQSKIGLALVGKFFTLAFCVNMVTWCYEGLASFPVMGMKAYEYGWTFDWDLGSFGIGMLLSPQVNFSMLLGALMVWGGIKPWLGLHKDRAKGVEDGWFNSETDSRYLGLYAYGLFAGIAIMVVQGVWGICEIAFTIIRSYVKKEIPPIVDDPLEQRKREIFEVKGFPWWGSVIGYCVMGGVTVVIHYFVMDVPWYQNLIAVAIVPLFAFSNIEGMGRTDWDVSSSYGKLMIFPIGAWNKGKSIIPSLAVCHTTISGCSNAATLMQDFKTGFLLGANPTIMFYAQIIGTVIGCVVCPGLFIMIRHAWTVPSTDPHAFVTGLYGPIFRALAVVATGNGFDALPKYCLYFALFFACFTLLCDIIQVLVDIFAPRFSSWVPQPSGLSIGALVGPCVSMEFTIGGIVAWWWARHRPTAAEGSVNYVASGTIAGSGFAIVAQCVVSFAGLKSPMEVAFVRSDASNDVSIGEWICGGILVALFVGSVILGAWVWFRVPDFKEGEGDDEEDDLEDEAALIKKRAEEEEARKKALEDYLIDSEDGVFRVDSSSTNGFAVDQHLV